MLITTSFLKYTVGLNRAPDSASKRKLKSKEKAAFSLRADIGEEGRRTGWVDTSVFLFTTIAHFLTDFQQTDNRLTSLCLVVLSALRPIKIWCQLSYIAFPNKPTWWTKFLARIKLLYQALQLCFIVKFSRAVRSFSRMLVLLKSLVVGPDLL